MVQNCQVNKRGINDKNSRELRKGEERNEGRKEVEERRKIQNFTVTRKSSCHRVGIFHGHVSFVIPKEKYKNQHSQKHFYWAYSKRLT